MKNLLNTTIEEFVTGNPISVLDDESIERVQELMVDSDIRHIVVLNELNNVAGILSERDILKFSRSTKIKKLKAKDIMNTDVFMVLMESKLSDVVFSMTKSKYGSAVVEDGVGELKGIFTVTDALNALIETLKGDFEEEIKGPSLLSQ